MNRIARLESLDSRLMLTADFDGIFESSDNDSVSSEVALSNVDVSGQVNQIQAAMVSSTLDLQPIEPGSSTLRGEVTGQISVPMEEHRYAFDYDPNLVMTIRLIPDSNLHVVFGLLNEDGSPVDALLGTGPGAAIVLDPFRPFVEPASERVDLVVQGVGDTLGEFTFEVTTAPMTNPAPSVIPPFDFIDFTTSDAYDTNNANFLEHIALARATDDIDTDLTITNDAPDFLPIGETIVTFTTEDSDGNIGSATMTALIAASPQASVSPADGQQDPLPLPDRDAPPTTWDQQRSSISQIVVSLGMPAESASSENLILTNRGMNPGTDPESVIALRDDQIDLSEDGLTLTINVDPNQMTDGAYRITLTEGIVPVERFEIDDIFVLEGDWNGSGAVNIQDFSTFAYWFGQTTDIAPEYVDLNESGSINIQDFAGFAANFGKQIVLPTNASETEGEQVTIDDAVRVIDSLHRQSQPTEDDLDFNADGTIEANDALYVINRVDNTQRNVFVEVMDDDEDLSAMIERMFINNLF